MKPVLVFVTVLIFGATGAPLRAQAQTPAAGADAHHTSAEKPGPVAGVPASLVGRWRSASFELDLVSDLHRSVYGPNARSVRVSEMVIRPSGEGTFTVTNLVRNRRGLAVAGTRSVEELRFVLGSRETAPGDRTRYAVKVERAERRYTDEPAGTFPLDGARLEVYLPSAGKGPVEVRYDTPEGSGSFWETLQPAAARPAARAAASSATTSPSARAVPAPGR